MTTDDLALRQANAAMTVAVAASVSSGTNGVAAAQSTADAAFSIAVAGTNAAGVSQSRADNAFSIAVAGTNAAGVSQSRADAAFSIAVAGTNAAGVSQSRADNAFSIAVAGTNAAAPFTTYGTTSATHQFYGTTAEGVMQGHTLVFLNGLLQSWTTV